MLQLVEQRGHRKSLHATADVLVGWREEETTLRGSSGVRRAEGEKLIEAARLHGFHLDAE